MAKTIVVENTESRVISIGGVELKPDHQWKDTLLPGVNEVDEEAWKKALAVPAVRALVKEGKLKPEPGKRADATALEDVDDALSLIAKTVDRSLLEAWARREKRPQVRDAIEAQLKAIQPKAPAKPDGQ